MPGDWYGPQAISLVLKRLEKTFQPVENFKMIVAKEGNIFLDRIAKKAEEGWKNSLFIVVPLRLGLNKIEPEYLQSIRMIYQKLCIHNVGIAGGRDFSALYFVGLSDSDNLIYLDPHFVMKSIPSSEFTNEDLMLQYSLQQYHCKKMKTLKLDQMCTSVAIGFYIRNESQFLDFKEKIFKMSKEDNSIFSVYEKKPIPVEIDEGVL